MNVKLGGLLLVAASFLMVMFPIQSAVGQTPTGTIVVPESMFNSGNTLVANVTIKNVQNLWGIDATITWDSRTMQLVKVSDWLGAETYPGGVLHETPTYPIAIAANETSQESGSHHIAAISQGDAAPFYGSGTIATLTFTVTGTQSTINVTSELADYPEPGETTSEPIPHTDLGLIVETMPITSPTINPSTTPQPTPSPSVPEFPQTAIIILVLAAATIISIGFGLVRRKASKPASTCS
jgi:hypothetical protein